ncbi:hypothetical protein GCM10010211_13790 [Streptomyces albospinus]|uniref:Uncharacterized protein n=1 Tax=Streptomyces albospinus TaxID=285515 RepID=A0ABQ2URT4_9ACTN|nr:hypothetical protein GCM10010211_13790 [Streptomyces albospinus]
MTEAPGDRIADAAGRVTDRVRQVIDRVGCSRHESARRMAMDPSELSRSPGGTRRFTLAEIVLIADIGGGYRPAAARRPGTPGAAALP